MSITKKTKLYVKKSFPPGSNMVSGKFYAQIGGALWDVTEEVFNLYCKGHPQCSLYRGKIGQVDLANIPAVSLENVK